MANHVSALKRVRQSQKRRLRNRAVNSTVRTAIKKLSADIAENQAGSLESTLKAATSILARAASKGVIPKRRAARKISKLTLKANRVLLEVSSAKPAEKVEPPVVAEPETPTPTEAVSETSASSEAPESSETSE